MERQTSWGQQEADTRRVSSAASATWFWTRTSPWLCRPRNRRRTRTRASPERHPYRPAVRWLGPRGPSTSSRRHIATTKKLMQRIQGGRPCLGRLERFVTRAYIAVRFLTPIARFPSTLRHFCTDFLINDEILLREWRKHLKKKTLKKTRRKEKKGRKENYVVVRGQLNY